MTQKRDLEPWLGPVAVLVASTVGGLATASSVQTWYPTLQKPPFNPPSAVFGPVWTVLYILIAAAFILYCRSTPPSDRRPGRIAFFTQITLNLLWSLAFFGLQSPLAGLLVILALDAAIVANIVTFARRNRLPAGLLVPYLLWTGFATILNASIWLLNR